MTTTQPAPTFESMHEWLRTMRETDPVLVDTEHRTVQLFRYAEVFTALTEYHDFSSDLSSLVPVSDDLALFAKGNFISLDPPEHNNLRGLVSRVFTPKMINGLEPRIAEVTDELLGETEGEFDLVDLLAYPLPVIVIAQMLGIPTSDRPVFRRWADALLSQTTDPGAGVDALNDEVMAGIAPVMKEMNEYLLAHIKRCRANPGDDLTSRLTLAEADGRTLTDDQIVGFVGLLLIAGHITTTALLGNSVLIMEANPGVADRLRADPALIPHAVEEFLRFRSPFPRLGRRTIHEMKIGDITVPPDYIVLPWVASANRDAAQFADPDAVDIDRSPNHHLAFGKGIHFCIGAPLARLEARVALEHLLGRFRSVAVSGEVESFPVYSMAAAKRLPVEVQR